MPRRGVGYGLLRYLARTPRPPRRSPPCRGRGQLQLPRPARPARWPRRSPFAGASRIERACRRARAHARAYLLEIGASVARRPALDVTCIYSGRASTAATRSSGWQRLRAPPLRALIAHCRTPEAERRHALRLPARRVEPGPARQAVALRRPGRRRGVRRGRTSKTSTRSRRCSGDAVPRAVGAGLRRLRRAVQLRRSRAASTPRAFRRAWQLVIERHAVLRTAFVWEGVAEPLQVVRRTVRLPLARGGLARPGPGRAGRASGPASRGGAPPRLRPGAGAADAREPAASGRAAPPLRLDLPPPAARRLVARPAAGRGLRRSTTRCARRTAFGRPAPPPYRDYIAWLQRQDVAAAEAFWRGRAGRLHRADTARHRAKPLPARRPAQRPERLRLPAPRDRASCKPWPGGAGSRSTPWSRAPGRCSSPATPGRRTWSSASSCRAGRPELPGVESIVGLFINTLPVRVATPRRRGACCPGSSGCRRRAARAAPVRVHAARPDPALERGARRGLAVREPLRLRELPRGSGGPRCRGGAGGTRPAPGGGDGLPADGERRGRRRAHGPHLLRSRALPVGRDRPPAGAPGVPADGAGGRRRAPAPRAAAAAGGRAPDAALRVERHRRSGSRKAGR